MKKSAFVFAICCLAIEASPAWSDTVEYTTGLDFSGSGVLIGGPKTPGYFNNSTISSPSFVAQERFDLTQIDFGVSFDGCDTAGNCPTTPDGIDVSLNDIAGRSIVKTWHVANSPTGFPYVATIDGISGVTLENGARYSLTFTALGNTFALLSFCALQGEPTCTIDPSEITNDIPVAGDEIAFDVIGNPVAATVGVPEPASWAMMAGGFGLVGGALRGRRRAAVSFA